MTFKDLKLGGDIRETDLYKLFNELPNGSDDCKKLYNTSDEFGGEPGVRGYSVETDNKLSNCSTNNAAKVRSSRYGTYGGVTLNKMVVLTYNYMIYKISVQSKMSLDRDVLIIKYGSEEKWGSEADDVSLFVSPSNLLLIYTNHLFIAQAKEEILHKKADDF